MRKLSREQHTYIAEIAKISSDGYGNKTVCLTNVDDGCGNIVALSSNSFNNSNNISSILTFLLY